MTPETIARECAKWGDHTDLPWNLRKFLWDAAEWVKEATAREATARSEGQEDVLRFIRNGHFLHDDAPTKLFAKEVENNWNSHGKAAADRTRSAP